MHTVVQYSPGQTVTITVSVFDSSGLLADGYSLPSITKVIMPNITVAAGFPKVMTKISTGLYQSKFQLPSGGSAVGSYVVQIDYTDPVGNAMNEVVEVLCTAPFANFSVSPG